MAVVDKVVDKKGTREVAEAYLEYLYSPEGQEIAASNYYRPIDPTAAAKYAKQFPKLNLFTIDEVFGGWAKAQKDALRRRRHLRPDLRRGKKSTVESDVPVAHAPASGTACCRASTSRSASRCSTSG